MVKDVFIFSDKCTGRELLKTNDEFAKDLKKLRYKTRVSVWKYIKDPDAKNGADEDDNNDGGAPQETQNYENVVSQNPKINQQIIQGIAEQITSSHLLQTFKLVNFRLSAHSWQVLGRGIGNCKNLKHFSVNASNLYQDNNLRKLLDGMI